MSAPNPKLLPRELLATTAADWGLTLSAAQLAQYERYLAELLRWNRRANLTAIVDPQAAMVRHVLDALAVARVWPAQPPASLADVGTGAGVPGLVLKILWPDTELLLIESVAKKTDFLQHVTEVLELRGVTILTARAEDVGRDPRYRERYAAVTARAVAALNVLVEYCLPLCCSGGVVVAPKGADGAAEAAAAATAIELLGGRLRSVLTYQLPGLDPRTLVVIDKCAPTPERYPRRAGVPHKRPLSEQR